MSAPTLKAGENPTADAAAAEHVKGLYSTGMQFEFAPSTVATRAFLDGFALGAATLAEAEALREGEGATALRARVAELEKEAMILRGTVEAVTTQRQQAEQRKNAMRSQNT